MQVEEEWDYEDIPDANSEDEEVESIEEIQKEVKKKNPKRRLFKGTLKLHSMNYFFPFKTISFRDFQASESFGPVKFDDGIRRDKKLVFDPSKMMVKMTSTTGQIVEASLNMHGFISTNGPCNILWSGNHFTNDGFIEMNLNPYQKVNHFPRTVEITRKDKLYQQIKRMQDTYGYQEFGFVPHTFVLPAERTAAIEAIKISTEKEQWILKPVGSSRGRGIYIVNKKKKLGEDKKCIISQYIDNPLLIDGRKFDIRIYALVTSFDPLVLYLYHDGLARFATELYRSAAETFNRFVHLTNYSVNKMNTNKFIANEDENKDNVGSKWSYTALRAYFESIGINFKELIEKRIHDVVVKTILSIKPTVAAATEKCTSYRGNCFELFGFDIMFDQRYQPWLLEVNLSPSLSCDSPLDHKIKATMVTDLFNLIGVVPCPLGEAALRMKDDTKIVSYPGDKESVLRLVNEEYERRGGWIRIYPAATYKRYTGYRETQTLMNTFVCESTNT